MVRGTLGPRHHNNNASLGVGAVSDSSLDAAPSVGSQCAEHAVVIPSALVVAVASESQCADRAAELRRGCVGCRRRAVTRAVVAQRSLRRW